MLILRNRWEFGEIRPGYRPKGAWMLEKRQEQQLMRKFHYGKFCLIQDQFMKKGRFQAALCLD
jgi:hypothetical protein